MGIMAESGLQTRITTKRKFPLLPQVTNILLEAPCYTVAMVKDRFEEGHIPRL